MIAGILFLVALAAFVGSGAIAAHVARPGASWGVITGRWTPSH